MNTTILSEYRKTQVPGLGTCAKWIILTMIVFFGQGRLIAQERQSTEEWFEFKPDEDFSESVIDA